jgi:hypothetical protein
MSSNKQQRCHRGARGRPCVDVKTQKADHMTGEESTDRIVVRRFPEVEASVDRSPRAIRRQLDALMPDQGLPKSGLAKRMKTSRARLDRLLDPDNESVTLGTLTRAVQRWDGSVDGVGVRLGSWRCH